jgi:hypothetical protein
LVFGDADNSIAPCLESPVPPAVLAEGTLRAVGFEAVELGDQARVGPEAVDLIPLLANLEPSVEPRPRNPMRVEEGKKELLERAPNPPARIVAKAFETNPSDRSPSMQWIPPEKRRQRNGPVDPAVFHLP